MNKKLLTIFLSIFLMTILSISCTNKDKTAPTNEGIEKFNGRNYKAEGTDDNFYLSVKDGEAITDFKNGSYPQHLKVSKKSSLIYSFSLGDGTVKGELKFNNDGSSVTVTYEKHDHTPSLIGHKYVCHQI
ncbi:hypothetical protein [Brachyspira sp.]|uniref:hypothetical protein n=1 Tax=Brachyspira sp. TaxID=1977261 RepID=UPI002610FE27|nr:hypothetical protein [Brachyspira sp.]